MDNVFTPPRFRTVTPPTDHLRTAPDYLHIPDEARKFFWTNFDENLIKAVRRIKNK